MKKIKQILALGMASLIAIMGSGCQSNQVVAEVGNVAEGTITSSDVVEMERRIVPLSVSLVDILGELDIEMAGVPNTQYSLHEKAEGITQVGLSMSPDIEILAGLQPTHVLALSTLKSMVGPKLEQIGVEPIYLNMENIDELRVSIAEIGHMFDRDVEAAALIADFDAQLDAVIQSVAGKEAPKVLILFGFPGNYMVATGASFVGQMVDLLGGVNIVQDASVAYANVNMEELIIQAPDVILRLTHGIKEDVIEMFNKEFTENPIWQQFEAVTNGYVYDLDDSKFNVSATLQTAEALGELAEIIYRD